MPMDEEYLPKPKRRAPPPPSSYSCVIKVLQDSEDKFQKEWQQSWQDLTIPITNEHPPVLCEKCRCISIAFHS